MTGTIFAPSFVGLIRSRLERTEVRFLEAEQRLLEQKTFEDMVFTTTGLNENGDFFYVTGAENGPTVREQLTKYMELKDTLDRFVSVLLAQLPDIRPENRTMFQEWTHEQMIAFELKLEQLGICE